MSAAEQIVEKKPARVIIAEADAKKLRAKVQGMKRAALNIEMNARTFANEADSLMGLLDLLIEPFTIEPNEP